MWCLIVKEEEREKARENILSLNTKETGELSGGRTSSCMSSAKRPRCNTFHILAALPGQTPTAWQLSGPTSGPMRLAAISGASLTQMSNYSPPSDPRVLWPGLELRLSSPTDRCAKRVGVRTVLHLHSPCEIPFKVTPLWWKKDLIPGCSLHFLYPKFQQSMRSWCYVPRPCPKEENCWPAGERVVPPRELGWAPEAMIVSFLQTTSLWLSGSCSVAQSCLTLCDPMNCSTPGLPVHHQLPESTQTHVHWVNSSHEVAKVLEFQL